MQAQAAGCQRREFLKSTLAAAGVAALGAPAVGKEERTKTITPGDTGIPTRRFGKTGYTLPILGMGGSAMVKQWVAAYGVPLLGTDERVAMLRHAYDKGIRYFDTARVYGESESIIGKGLNGIRDQVYLATKVAVFKPEAVRQSLETSLKQLDTSYVDAAQIHSPSIERLGFEGAMKVHAELVKLRDEKMLRFIGLTTHVAFQTVYKMICTGGFDQVLLAYGYFNKGMDTLLSHRNLSWRELCLAEATQRNMAIVAMKVMGANILGHNSKNLVPDYDKAALAKLPPAAIRWVVRDERVSMLNIGVSFPADIDSNIAVLKGDLTLTNNDRLALADYAQRAYEANEIKKMQIVQHEGGAAPALC
jgi:predicted aldo/keto reductase-like oxidoreductase